MQPHNHTASKMKSLNLIVFEPVKDNSSYLLKSIFKLEFYGSKIILSIPISWFLGWTSKARRKKKRKKKLEESELTE